MSVAELTAQVAALTARLDEMDSMHRKLPSMPNSDDITGDLDAFWLMFGGVP